MVLFLGFCSDSVLPSAQATIIMIAPAIIERIGVHGGHVVLSIRISDPFQNPVPKKKSPITIVKKIINFSHFPIMFPPFLEFF